MTTKESASAELLPCPFCQSNAVEVQYNGSGDYEIMCHKCMSCGPFGRSAEHAAAAWNCRPTTPRAESADYAELRRLAVAAKSCATPYDVAWRKMSGALDPAQVLAMIDRLEELEKK